MKDERKIDADLVGLIATSRPILRVRLDGLTSRCRMGPEPCFVFARGVGEDEDSPGRFHWTNAVDGTEDQSAADCALPFVAMALSEQL